MPTLKSAAEVLPEVVVAEAGEGAQASAADAVFYGVVNGLEAQLFVPSQRLVEAELAQRFGVGRNSAREGLQRLAAEGIVELHRHKGASVRSLSLAETLDVLDVAERMTGLLTRHAARGATRPEAVAALQQSLAALAEADAARDGAAFSAARRAFYRGLLDMGGNRELRRLFPAIHMPIVYAQFRLPGLQKLRLRDYRRIAVAVSAGREPAADAAGAAHVRHVRDEILRMHAPPSPSPSLV